ncbi:pyruvate dehydrogenase (quinone) [Micromonospora viridifaciens]|uniref:Pyruvate dehydrogenase (Quinone) n=1 Tax=Micromonospora viridifaciens TaxID=1881 RepID=A0A1C4YCY7_MICVI|nr:thiamine pyrophosphate-dependent enzyme [Micromonospora viridifaciens]SCF18544.1 pyruvate dehydrogenase (quinone) [Micromonospora viridifaciens]
MATTSEIMIDRLLEWGINTYFGLPGDGIDGFFEGIRRRRDRIRFVHVRHEEEAALAAVGHAKLSGRPAVCVSTSGPGAAHLLNGLYDARVEGYPLIAITGLQFHDMLGTHYLQDINHHYAFADACVYNQQVNGPAHAGNVVDMAVRRAMSLRGPAHLCIPVDIQEWELDADHRSDKNIDGHSGVVALTDTAPAPSEDTIAAAAEVLNACRKPVIIAGSGARGAHAELEQVAELLGAGVVKPALGKDVLGDDSPYVLGGIAFAGTAAAQQALGDCDGLLIVGSSTGYFDFWPQPGQARGVQIDVEPSRIGMRYPVEVGVVGDARQILGRLVPHLRRNEDRSFLEHGQQAVRDWWQLMDAQAASTDMPMRPQVVIGALSGLLADDAIVCGDAGTVTVWQGRMRMRTGQRFTFSGTHCSMAAAIPYAIGAQTAFPGRQVIAFVGDGGASMLMGSLATLAMHHLPVTVVVVNNASLGLIVWEQMSYLGNPESECALSRIDFAQVADGCGVRGFHVENPTGCREALAAAIAHDGPALVDCWVDPEEPAFAETLKPAQLQHVITAMRAGTPGAGAKATRLLEPGRLAVAPALKAAEQDLRDIAGTRQA